MSINNGTENDLLQYGCQFKKLPKMMMRKKKSDQKIPTF